MVANGMADARSETGRDNHCEGALLTTHNSHCQIDPEPALTGTYTYWTVISMTLYLLNECLGLPCELVWLRLRNAWCRNKIQCYPRTFGIDFIRSEFFYSSVAPHVVPTEVEDVGCPYVACVRSGITKNAIDFVMFDVEKKRNRINFDWKVPLSSASLSFTAKVRDMRIGWIVFFLPLFFLKSINLSAKLRTPSIINTCTIRRSWCRMGMTKLHVFNNSDNSILEPLDQRQHVTFFFITYL